MSLHVDPNRTIIVMNLLIGLAVDDIKGVQDQAVLKRLAMQVREQLKISFRFELAAIDSITFSGD